MATAVFECARTFEEKSCSVKIIGEHDDVVNAAHDHLVGTHGLTEGDDLKKKVTAAVEEHQTKYGVWGH
jgi:predicted small metal-binding protein